MKLIREDTSNFNRPALQSSQSSIERVIPDSEISGGCDHD
jgi:hypothetical protein